MALRLSVRHIVGEAALWLGVATAGFASFTYFEDVYREAERRWGPIKSNTAWQMPPSPPVGGDRGAMIADDALASYGLRQSLPERGRSVLLRANPYGHFDVEADVNGHKVDFLTDTGATYVALNYETALQLGFGADSLHFTSQSSTANGIARVAPITLRQIRIGDITIRNVLAVVGEPGRMSQNLLGMSFINRLSGFELRGNRLTLIQ